MAEDSIKDKAAFDVSTEPAGDNLMTLTETVKASKEGKLHPMWFVQVAAGWLSIVCQGMDGATMSVINAMPQFQQHFGLSGRLAGTGLAYAMFFIGALAVVMGPASLIADRWGRKWGMLAGQICIVIATFILLFSPTLHAFYAGRFVLGLGAGLALAVAPPYVAEISPPHLRGRVTGMAHVCYFVGSITMTGVSTATTKFSGDLAWRLPLIVQFIPSAFAVVCILLSSDSPRWLMSVGREDEMQQYFIKYHGSGVRTPVVDMQIKEITADLKGKPRLTYWSAINVFAVFANRNLAYRACCVIAIGTIAQMSGNSLITFYAPSLYKNAGITTTAMQLKLTFINACISFLGAILGASFLDHVGRRRILLGGVSALLIFLTCTTVCSHFFYVSKSVATLGICFLYFFQFTAAFTLNPVSTLYPAEAMPFDFRMMGSQLYGFTVEVWSIVNSWGMSQVLDRIGIYTYIIYIIICCFEIAVIYFFLPETNGRTMEEMNEVFDAPNPVKFSLQHKEPVVEVDTDTLSTV